MQRVDNSQIEQTQLALVAASEEVDARIQSLGEEVQHLFQDLGTDGANFYSTIQKTFSEFMLQDVEELSPAPSKPVIDKKKKSARHKQTTEDNKSGITLTDIRKACESFQASILEMQSKGYYSPQQAGLLIQLVFVYGSLVAQKLLLKQMETIYIKARLMQEFNPHWNAWTEKYRTWMVNLQQNFSPTSQRVDVFLRAVFSPENLQRNAYFQKKIEEKRVELHDKLNEKLNELNQEYVTLDPLDKQALQKRNELLKKVEIEVDKLQNGIVDTYLADSYQDDFNQRQEEINALFQRYNEVRADTSFLPDDLQRQLDGVKEEIRAANRQLGNQQVNSTTSADEILVSQALIVYVNLMVELHQLKAYDIADESDKLTYHTQRFLDGFAGIIQREYVRLKSFVEEYAKAEDFVRRTILEIKKTPNLNRQAPNILSRILAIFKNEKPQPNSQPPIETQTFKLEGIYSLCANIAAQIRQDFKDREDFPQRDHLAVLEKALAARLPGAQTEAGEQAQLSLLDAIVATAVKNMKAVEDAAYAKVFSEFKAGFLALPQQIKEKTSYFKRHPMQKTMLKGVGIALLVTLLVVAAAVGIWASGGLATPFIAIAAKAVLVKFGLLGTIGMGISVGGAAAAIGAVFGAIAEASRAFFERHSTLRAALKWSGIAFLSVVGVAASVFCVWAAAPVVAAKAIAGVAVAAYKALGGLYGTIAAAAGGPSLFAVIVGSIRACFGRAKKPRPTQAKKTDSDSLDVSPTSSVDSSPRTSRMSTMNINSGLSRQGAAPARGNNYAAQPRTSAQPQAQASAPATVASASVMPLIYQPSGGLRPPGANSVLVIPVVPEEATQAASALRRGCPP